MVQKLFGSYIQKLIQLALIFGLAAALQATMETK
jgi:hypothetical protein